MSISLTTENTEKNRLGVLRVLGGKFLFAFIALGLGLAIARLPLTLSAALFGGAALAALAMLQPLVGLSLMLLIGPAKALLAAVYPSMPIDPGQIGMALFAGAWLLRGLARRRIHWPALPITLPFALFLFVAALSLTVAHPRSPLDGVQELIKWAEMLAVAALVVDCVGVESAATASPGGPTPAGRRVGWVVATLLIVGAAQAAIGLWEYGWRGTGPAPFLIPGNHYRAYGTFEQPNPFGGFMGMVWPIAAAVALSQVPALRRAAASAWRAVTQRTAFGPWVVFAPALVIALAGAAVAAASLAALYASYSRGSWLGAAAAAVVMLIFWPRRRWVGLALAGGGLAAVLGLYQFGLLPSFLSARFADVGDFLQVSDVRGVPINDTNFSIVERLAHWQAAVNMAQANPVLGVGLGNYEAAYDEYRLINWKYALGHAHMIYLNMLAETGVLGLAAYLVLWGAIIALTLRAAARTAGPRRALAVGLLAVWAHLAVHQLLDNLYVDNIPLYLGAQLGLLCLLIAPNS
ncbi:MAG: O-antigen ligase family protein [Chloroflexi bacterium]|nr:O-antigen ligase family protein [Chloroflexota bacterium]